MVWLNNPLLGLEGNDSDGTDWVTAIIKHSQGKWRLNVHAISRIAQPFKQGNRTSNSAVSLMN